MESKVNYESKADTYSEENGITAYDIIDGNVMEYFKMVDNEEGTGRALNKVKVNLDTMKVIKEAVSLKRK